MKQTKERLLHHVSVSVFSKPHDNDESVRKGLDQLSPIPVAVLLQQDPEYDPERPHTIHYRMPNVVLTVQKTDTDEGKMTIYTLFFKKMSDVNHCARQLVAAMTPFEKEEYARDPSLLLDAEARLSLRLDKELLQMGKWSLTDDGVCYQIKASVAAYPKSATLAVVKRILG